MDYCQKAIEKFPESYLPVILLTELMHDNGKTDKALTFIEKFDFASPDFIAVRAMITAIVGKTEQAKRYFKSIPADYPLNPETCLRIGMDMKNQEKQLIQLVVKKPMNLIFMI